MCSPGCGMVLAANRESRKVAYVVVAAVFLSWYFSGSLPFVQCHITINKMC